MFDEEDRAAIDGLASSVDAVARAMNASAETGSEAFENLAISLHDGFEKLAKEISEHEVNPLTNQRHFIAEASIRIMAGNPDTTPAFAARVARTLWTEVEKVS